MSVLAGTNWCGINDIADNYHDLGQDFRYTAASQPLEFYEYATVWGGRLSKRFCNMFFTSV